MDLNLKLRTRILELSLQLENRLSEILSILFNIEKDTSKTLAYSSKALTFKTKVDILRDLGMFNDYPYSKKYNIVYNDLIFFMEVRNQFMHNLEANNITDVLNWIQKLTNMKKRMKIYENFGIVDDGSEEMYFRAFEQMALHIDGLLYEFKNEIIEDQERQLEEKWIALDRERFLNAFEMSFKAYYQELNNKNDKKVLNDFVDYLLKNIELLSNEDKN